MDKAGSDRPDHIALQGAGRWVPQAIIEGLMMNCKDGKHHQVFGSSLMYVRSDYGKHKIVDGFVLFTMQTRTDEPSSQDSHFFIMMLYSLEFFRVFHSMFPCE
jgi:hypothetical protein